MASIKKVLDELRLDSKKSIWTNTKRFTNSEVNAYLEGKQTHHEKVIYTLGEWAWEQLKFHIKNTWTYKNPIALYYAIENGYSEEKTPKGLALKSAYHEIAVACLGENEIKKRLSEL